MTLPLFDDLDRIQRDVEQPRRLQLVSPFSGPSVSGIEDKDEALARVMRKKAARDYRDRLIEALKLFPVRSRITIEQLRGAISGPPAGVHFNVMGSIVNYMARRDMIRKTGRMVQAQRPGMHATELAEWEVVKYA